MWGTITAGREWHGEFHNRKKCGELFWASSKIGPVFDEDGQITHYLSVQEDITERKVSEERIREQAALLDVTQDAIFVVNRDRTVTYWNRSAAIMYDIPPDTVGRSIEELVYLETPTNFAAQWSELLELGEWSGEQRGANRSGRMIDARVRTKVIANSKGEAADVLLVITDITESKQLEAQFLRVQRLESLGTLASGVSHDLNNVLSPIIMAAELLRPLAKSSEDREILQVLTDSARRGADIVQQLLLFGRGSDSPRAPLNAGDIIKDMGRMMRSTFPKNIVLSVQAPADLLQVEADRTQVHQVVLNLCVNARDAMPHGGRLTLTAENVQVDAAFARNHNGKRTGSHVRIQVCDTGTGIAPEHLEKIFDPFFTTKPLGQGTGLGLSTVVGIVRSHQGIVNVHSAVGQGTTFEVFLPAVEFVGGLGSCELERKDLMGRGELILVVEDEECIRSILQRTLTDHHYRVLIASDGAEALGVFVQNAASVNAVITDVMMPVMDGAQTVRALRRLKPDLPVVVMSGSPAHRAEFEDFSPRLLFFQKPFETDNVLQMLREALTQRIGAIS